ncbi:MAG: hypothetical protein IPO46_09925 [Chitinophagaceae bacterium]|nr:MAG: hypothetical protein IPO46_09925 [Chitinophagaceae bacterium]
METILPFILAILATDLLIGVSIGLLLSTYFIIRSNFKTEYKITKKTINEIETEHIKLNSDVTFLNKVSLKKALDEVAENSVPTIDGSSVILLTTIFLKLLVNLKTRQRKDIRTAVNWYRKSKRNSLLTMKYETRTQLGKDSKARITRDCQ